MNARPSFSEDVYRFTAGPTWVTEWEYGVVRATWRTPPICWCGWTCHGDAGHAAGDPAYRDPPAAAPATLERQRGATTVGRSSPTPSTSSGGRRIQSQGRPAGDGLLGPAKPDFPGSSGLRSPSEAALGCGPLREATSTPSPRTAFLSAILELWLPLFRCVVVDSNHNSRIPREAGHGDSVWGSPGCAGGR